ncbi:uncharacterized protein APUU_40652S [Aspergillus puulaauensis]|uniref:Carboxylic ester hydrolase n=1 Tax=Aspergillus puulaauensis TaxID=1220207 RepID=A0A7R7XNI8_9EURO|nr:uncharacterized protein APUU_40652S [Aspergillus puulaauensis]BCS24208.1 hypothetical protein APUU_40652S [Aspergillus puulaauensis]
MKVLTQAITIIAASAATTAAYTPCTSDTFNLPNATIDSISHHQNNTTIPLPLTVNSCGGPASKANITNSICRLVVNISTTATSSVRIEAWLPDPETWNGRLLATGTGGIGGCIDYTTIQNGAQLGFASFGTNAGHDGSEGYEFFLGKPEVINDFGYRAVHVEAEIGKEVVTQYYGRNPERSYYQGCSTGGRQGLQSAQLYPGDFNGIIAGAPGIDWLRIVASKGILARRVGWPDIHSAGYVRPEQWAAIVQKQVEIYDPLDGVEDGVIDDPTQHSFDPEILACGTGFLNDSLCLSAAQVQSVRAAYLPIANSTGQIVYPAFGLGADTSVFSDNQVDGKPELAYTILQDFWRGAVYNDSTWTPHNFSTADMDNALKISPGGVNAASPDLTRFYQKGGKIISYHGCSDETVTPRLSMEYYVSVQAALNLTLDEIHSFYRLFWVPGMHHCSGGPGASAFGQSYPLDPGSLSPERNVLLALVEWVERGTAPEALIGTKYEGDVTSKVEAQRKHCYYPNRSVWDGSGGPNAAGSWNCQGPA